MTHEEIRELLKLQDSPTKDCRFVNHILEEHISHVTQRIAELEILQQQLLQISKHCSASTSVDDCGIIQKLAEMDIPASLHKTHLS